MLRHSDEYSESVLNEVQKTTTIPQEIMDGFDRLDMQRWKPKLVREYRTDLVDKRKYSQVIEAERAEGKAEGEKIGEEKVRRAFISKLLKKGRSVEEIMELTEFTREEILKIAT